LLNRKSEIELPQDNYFINALHYINNKNYLRAKNVLEKAIKYKERDSYMVYFLGIANYELLRQGEKQMMKGKRKLKKIKKLNIPITELAQYFKAALKHFENNHDVHPSHIYTCYYLEELGIDTFSEKMMRYLKKDDSRFIRYNNYSHYKTFEHILMLFSENAYIRIAAKKVLRLYNDAELSKCENSKSLFLSTLYLYAQSELYVTSVISNPQLIKGLEFESPSVLLLNAKSLYLQGNYDKSLRKLNKYLRIESFLKKDHKTAYLYMALNLFKKENRKDAIQMLNSVKQTEIVNPYDKALYSLIIKASLENLHLTQDVERMRLDSLTDNTNKSPEEGLPFIAAEKNINDNGHSKKRFDEISAKKRKQMMVKDLIL
jgi:hypothetical protein